MRTICPHCRTELDLPEELVGKAFRCGSCQEVIKPDQVSPSRARQGEQLDKRSARVHSQDDDLDDDVDRDDDRETTPRRRSRDGFRMREDDDRNYGRKRKSSGKTWLWILLGLFVVGGLGCGGCITAVVIAMKPSWTPYSAADQSFSVEFPGKVKDQSRPMGTFTLKMKYAERLFGREAYLVGWADLPNQNLSARDKEQVLTDACEGGVRGYPGSTEESRRSIKLEGHPGKEMVIRVNNKDLRGKMVMRIYVVDSRLYMLITAGGGSGADKDISARFFDSFKIKATTSR